MSKSYLIASGKGGVGKSTLSAALGAAFAKRGKRVLIIDMDMGMRNMDIVLGVRKSVRFNLYDAVKKLCSIQMALVAVPENPGLYLLPAANLESIKDIEKDELKRFTERVKKEFDVIIIDAPSGVEKSFKAALRIAMNAIVVTTPDGPSMSDCINCADYLEKRGYDRPLLVVNRLREEWIRDGSMLSARDIAVKMRLPLLGGIPEDDMIYRASVRGENPTAASSVLLSSAVDMAARLCGEKRSLAVSPLDDSEPHTESELPIHPDLLAALRELEAQTAAAKAELSKAAEKPAESALESAPEMPKIPEIDSVAETAEPEADSSNVSVYDISADENENKAPADIKAVDGQTETIAAPLSSAAPETAQPDGNMQDAPDIEKQPEPPKLVPFIADRKRAALLDGSGEVKALSVQPGDGYPAYTVVERPKAVLVPFIANRKRAITLGGFGEVNALSVQEGEGYPAYTALERPKAVLVPFIADRKRAITLGGFGEVNALSVQEGEGYPAYTALECPKAVLVPFAADKKRAIAPDGGSAEAIAVQQGEEYPPCLPIKTLNILNPVSVEEISALCLSGGIAEAYPVSSSGGYPAAEQAFMVTPAPIESDIEEAPAEEDVPAADENAGEAEICLNADSAGIAAPLSVPDAESAPEIESEPETESSPEAESAHETDSAPEPEPATASGTEAEPCANAELTEFTQEYVSAAAPLGGFENSIPIEPSQTDAPKSEAPYSVDTESHEKIEYAPGHPLERPAGSGDTYEESAAETILPAEYKPKKRHGAFMRFLMRLFGIGDD
ncbi:MAG: AAA family ATPase [Eubacteriales bacterium]|nr:AAA family ATPase [Eubacteriales bacterium]MDD3882783.1 AAA family ATPase [Eubacteriales bacterium]MDD4512947.1 AAA family ATPase [Eubacteriales bacterium]